MIVCSIHYHSHKHNNIALKKRCEPLIAFTEAAHDGYLCSTKMLAPNWREHCLLFVEQKETKRGILCILFSCFISVKVSWAFGKREIIAMLC